MHGQQSNNNDQVTTMLREQNISPDQVSDSDMQALRREIDE